MIPIEEQIAELDRELKLREKVYPRWITAGKLSKENADQQIARLTAARETLLTVDAGLLREADAVRRDEANRVLNVILNLMHSSQAVKLEPLARRKLGL